MKIEGVYKFFQNGECVGEHKNNITETGRILAIKTLMGAVPSFGGSIHIGVDPTLNTYGYVPSGASAIVVSGTTPSQNVVVTVSSHTLSVGDVISISGITAAGITALNGTTQVITATTSTSVTFICTTSITNGTYGTAGTLGTFGTLATNTRLGFRVNSTSVLSSNIDNSVAYDAILFKAKLDDPTAYKIYEVGLYSDSLSGGALSSKNQLIVSFESGELLLDSGADLPVTGVATRLVSSSENANFRIGNQALQVVPGTNAKTATGYDLSFTSETDLINLAYYAPGAGTAVVTFYSGTTNYAVYTFTASATGYLIQSAARSTGTVTGTMDTAAWSNITKITFASTTSNMVFDGLRIDAPNIIDTINGLVSRTSLGSSPITKNPNTPLDIEYHMRLSFNG